jgi:hypothetical protein
MKVLEAITPEELLGRQLTDELSLNLAHAPAHGVRRELDDGGVRYAVALGQALGRRALMDLLYTLAPYKAHGPDRFARVLDNWALHDRAAGANNGASLALVALHAQSLKLSWQVFTEHRPTFFSIFADQTEGTRAVPLLTWERTAAGTRRWQFDTPDESLLQMLNAAGAVLDAETRPQLDALLGLVTVPYFVPELRKRWKAWQPLVKNGKSNYIGPASAPMICLLHRRALLNSTLVRAAEAWLDEAAAD